LKESLEKRYGNQNNVRMKDSRDEGFKDSSGKLRNRNLRTKTLEPSNPGILEP
jgi:hypothetical protein